MQSMQETSMHIMLITIVKLPFFVPRAQTLKLLHTARAPKWGEWLNTWGTGVDVSSTRSLFWAFFLSTHKYLFLRVLIFSPKISAVEMVKCTHHISCIVHGVRDKNVALECLCVNPPSAVYYVWWHKVIA